jgi:hypothetical protein
MGFFNGIFGKKAKPAETTAGLANSSKPNYGGYGSNGSGGLKRNNATKKAFFPRPSSFNTRNNRVPELSLNRRNGVQRTGFVSAQKNTNNIGNIRAKTFEQNFLWRILTKIENSIAVKSENPEPINLNEYKELLERPECTEEDAIFLYNELIAMFVALVVYYQLILRQSGMFILDGVSGKIKNPEVLQKLFNRKKIADIIFDKNLLNILTTAAVGAGILVSPVGIAISVSIGAFAVVGVGMVGEEITSGFRKTPNDQLKKEIVKMKLSLTYILYFIHFILFSEKNTIPIHKVRSKLKYWGLSESLVDFLFNKSPSDDEFTSIKETNNDNTARMLRYMEKYMYLPKSEALAPNERLSITSSSHIDELRSVLIKTNEYIDVNKALIKLQQEATDKNMLMAEYLRDNLKVSDNKATILLETAQILNAQGQTRRSQGGGRKRMNKNRKGGKRTHRR